MLTSQQARSHVNDFLSQPETQRVLRELGREEIYLYQASSDQPVLGLYVYPHAKQTRMFTVECGRFYCTLAKCRTKAGRVRLIGDNCIEKSRIQGMLP